MNIIEIILIGVALAMDACALTIANCTTYKKSLTTKKEWAMPIIFAVFQGVMPLLGYLIGYLFSDLLISVGSYLTSAIFFFLSGKIIFDILKESKQEKACEKCAPVTTAKFTFAVLLLQAIATSIDALAVGLTFVGTNTSVVLAILIISLTTFILVSLALFFGKKLGELFGKYAEWVGAIILFALAVKSLLEAIL
jgi:putative Mn2+ efflux pump MntP